MHSFQITEESSNIFTEIADFEENIDSNYVSDNYTFARNSWRKDTFKKISSEIKNDFSRFIYKEIKEVVTNNPVLNAIAQANVNRQEFKNFVVQHYFSADWFIELLMHGETLLCKLGHEELADEFRYNYEDEMGIANGVQVFENSHESWRQDYCQAISIDLKSEKPMDSTIGNHREPLKKLIIEKNGYFLAGMLAATEIYLVKEFQKIQLGRDKLFPEVFIITEKCSLEVVNKKKKNRKYIDDHIKHDALHYADILGPALTIVEKAKANNGIVNGYHVAEEIKAGIQAVTHAKEEFYIGLKDLILPGKISKY
ncbi:hypothetical protein [Nostoc sp. C117]|uniref:hypothetical protein n=1 Tax=Nostoc sp. C117 TaxID=3349875 RepID=UPI00370D87EE